MHTFRPTREQGKAICGGRTAVLIRWRLRVFPPKVMPAIDRSDGVGLISTPLLQLEMKVSCSINEDTKPKKN